MGEYPFLFSIPAGETGTKEVKLGESGVLTEIEMIFNRNQQDLLRVNPKYENQEVIKFAEGMPHYLSGDGERRFATPFVNVESSNHLQVYYENIDPADVKTLKVTFKVVPKAVAESNMSEDAQRMQFIQFVSLLRRFL